MKIIKFITLLSLIVNFTSCTGQVKTEKTISVVKNLGEAVKTTDDKIWSIFQDNEGNYWFGSNGQGIYHYDGKKLTRYSTTDGLIDNQIRGIQGDGKGNVFIETPKGVSEFNGKAFINLEVVKAPGNEWKLEDDDLWFKCNGRANEIYRYDGEQLFELPLPKGNLEEAFGDEVQGLSFKDMNNSPWSVFGINKDEEGNLWIGTISAGAFRYDGNSFLWITEAELTTLPDGRVPGIRSLVQDKDGYMWLSNFKSKYSISNDDSVATYNKLMGIAESSGYFNERLPYFNSGLSDDNNDLWMTTYGGGVWKYDGDKLLNLPVKNGDVEVLIVSIYKDNDGTLWLGTDNAGVYKFNGKVFEKFVFNAS